MKPFAEIVTDRLAELGLNVHQAEARAGFPTGYIRGVVRDDDKRASPSIDKAARIAEAIGLELYIGPRRPPPDAAPLPDEDYAIIPRLEVQLSAGPGAEGSNVVIERHAFRRDWLYRLGIDPARAAVVGVRGDSMAPGLLDGDLVLVDGKRTSIRPRRVYAFTDVDGQVRVKRLEPVLVAGDEPELLLRSDNADAPTEVRRGEDAARVVVHGEVVWSAHTWRQK